MCVCACVCARALTDAIVTTWRGKTSRADGWPAPRTRGCDRFCLLNLILFWNNQPLQEERSIFTGPVLAKHGKNQACDAVVQ